ncbi:MAG: peptidoglycan D,D-transpeptidase FtsI family protein [Roseburia sp.]
MKENNQNKRKSQAKKLPLTQKSKTSTKNKEFVVITYIFLLMFLAMMCYIVYFMAVKSEDFINSPYNSRQDSFSEYVIRGKILSADDKVLAETVQTSDGTEYRSYPYGKLYAHVVGYSSNGKSGIESAMNFNLLRSHAFIGERIVQELRGEKNEGDNVVTTLDSTLQETAYQALGGYDGAVIVMEPATGKILAMVSKPDYDPNTIAENWDSIVNSNSSVLLNRGTQGLYPPGSTFKIITTLEYMRENPDYNQYMFDCNGSFTSSGATIHCYNNKAHGEESLLDSFAHSCNASYANIGLSLDMDQMNSLCKDLLFGQKLPVDFESSVSTFSADNTSSASMVMETAIGQGETLVTPLHMLMITSAIANDGVLMKPYVVDHTENNNGVVVKRFSPTEVRTLISSQEASSLKEYMSAVTEEGTASALGGASYQAYGKTGSAEYGSTKGASHSWFVGFAHQTGKEDIAVVVIAEGAGAGSTVAVPAAKKILDAYYQ